MGQTSAASVPAMTRDEALSIVRRLAIQSVGKVDVANRTLKQIRFVGWVVEPDEHYRPGDGARMMEALELLAGVDVKALRRTIKVEMDAPILGSPAPRG